jgi:hypothetical protein
MGREHGSAEPGSRFRITVEELEKGVHIPPEKQVTTSAQDRVPAGTDAERQRLDVRLAGGA